ncbi:MAG: hypothetical protein ACM31C_18240 [Acidobacteriota bacterium]
MRASIVAAVLAARTAAAQAPADTAPAPDADRSVLTGYLISIAATGGPLVAGAVIDYDGAPRGWRPAAAGMLGIAGAIFGPSAGHWYAGEGLTPGLELRLGAGAVIATLAFRDPYLDHPTETFGGMLGAVAMWEAGVVWDAVTLPRAVRRANRRVVAPIFTGTGFAVAGTF